VAVVLKDPPFLWGVASTNFLIIIFVVRADTKTKQKKTKKMAPRGAVDDVEHVRHILYPMVVWDERTISMVHILFLSLTGKERTHLLFDIS